MKSFQDWTREIAERQRPAKTDLDAAVEIHCFGCGNSFIGSVWLAQFPSWCESCLRGLE